MLGELITNSLVVIVAILTIVERIGELFISWIPMYGEMKLALIIYLWYPKTMGTWYVYEALLRPFVENHETDIERSLKEMRAKAWDVAIYYWQNSTELGQTKFFEIFQYLVSTPSRPEILQNNHSSRDGCPPPPPINPTSFFRPDKPEERWTPTAPPLPNTSRSTLTSGHRESGWLKFRRSRGN